MRLGILDVLASPRVAHIRWLGSTTDTYIHFLQETAVARGMPFTFVGYDVAGGEMPKNVDACDAYLVTGSVSGVYDDDPWIAPLMAFVRAAHRAGKKLVGICFGHQILAHALGGRAAKSDKGWGLGLKPFAITQPKPWMSGAPAQCQLYFSHQDQVITLPPGAERLGSSAFCKNAMFSLDDRVLGIQGHPEFTPGIMHDILAKPKPAVTEEVRATAVASVKNGAPDNQLLAQWVVNFLVGNEEVGD